jgi:hypothetical protein
MNIVVPPEYQLTIPTSLHISKEKIRKSYQESQAQDIAGNLEEHLNETWKQAPKREPQYKYPLDREGVQPRTTGYKVDIKKDLKEVHWEIATWENRRNFQNNGPIQKLRSYQVMLRGSKGGEGWGEVDLIAQGKDGYPVVIELKANHGELMVRAICEGVAYAIAIQKNWPIFGPQWTEVTRKEAASCPKKMNIVIAAPVDWFKQLGEATKAVQKLISELSKRHYELHFLQLIDDGLGSDQLPRNVRPKWLDWPKLP